MKSVITALLTLALALTSCGEYPEEYGTDGKDGKDGETGPQGSDGADGKDGADGEDFTPAASVSLDGYYMLPSGGYLELLKNSEGQILINGIQRIYSSNTDNSLSLFTSLAVGPYTVRDGVVRTEYNATYVALSNNVHILATNTAIVGTRKTVTTFSKNSAGKLVINIKVYGASGLTIEADRTIVSQ